MHRWTRSLALLAVTSLACASPGDDTEQGDDPSSTTNDEDLANCAHQGG